MILIDGANARSEAETIEEDEKVSMNEIKLAKILLDKPAPLVSA